MPTTFCGLPLEFVGLWLSSPKYAKQGLTGPTGASGDGLHVGDGRGGATVGASIITFDVVIAP